MAVRISPPQNKTYYINPAYLTFVENSGYGANLIQVSASSSCYISVYDPANGIGYSDADRNYQRWKVTAYNNKFPDNKAWYIYVRLERNGTSALVVYDQVQLNVDGSTEEDATPSESYWFIKIGEVGATDGASIREITYDTGYLTSDEATNDKTDESEMWRLDKFSTPNLIEALKDLKSFVVRGYITLIGGLIFKKGDAEKPVTDLKRSTDSDESVPVSDETIPTTQYVQNKLEGFDERFLSKVKPDETEHRVKFKDGIEAGEFVTGMVGGTGAQIDSDGRGEMHSLVLREFLEVPELRFNRVDVVSGELWNSIAFGLVESVDTVKRICTLKLEDGERSGLKPNDICRGIFSDFGTGTVTDEEEDQNGFKKMFGFSTCYFTPTEILVNEEGNFQFRYNLQEGTSVHPCPSMKFAVYGNFIDTARQASAYSTRTYKRYLNKVNTWKLDLDKNLYAQYGDIEGLTIGGYTMHGYGSFQHNVYLTGSTYQFTPQQKEELKGEDAYSVTLSDYEGIVVIDDEGNVIGGESMLMNVITTQEADEDRGETIVDGGTFSVTATQKSYTTDRGTKIAAGTYNVTTSAYRLTTQVQAMRGSTVLHHALAPEKDAYVIGLDAVGCTAMVLNGVVVVTSILEPKNCKVNITVNCEGKTPFQKTYRITTVTDGKNPIVADLDNEMDAVACDPEGKVLFGLPVKTTVGVWAGTKQLVLDEVTVTPPQGVTVEQYFVDQNGKKLSELTEEETAAVEYTSCVISIPAKTTVDGEEIDGITQEAERTLPIVITAYAYYGGIRYHRTLTFTVNKIIAGENAVIYKLLPSVTSVKVYKDNKLSTDAVSCSVVGFDGKKSVPVAELGDNFSSNYVLKYAVKPQKKEGEEAPVVEYSDYTINTPVSITKDDDYVGFQLYWKSGETLLMIDSETIPIIRDGNAIENVGEYYLASSYNYGEGVTRENGPWGTWQEGVIPELSEEKRYLWNYEIINYSGTQPTYTDPTIIAWWTKDGRGVKDVIEWYQVNNDKDTIPSYDDSRWVSKVAPQMDKDNRYLWNYEQVIWTEGEDTRTEPAVIGVFGNDGISALSLVASTSTISRNSFGSYQPASVRVRVLRAGVEEEKYISAWGLDADGNATPVILDADAETNCVYASYVDIKPGTLSSKDFASLVFRIYDNYVTAYVKDDSTDLDEVTIVFVGDGSSGPMPRNRGQYSSSENYFYNDTYRDFVWTTAGKVFMREGKGDAYSKNETLYDSGIGQSMEGGITSVPTTNTTYWVEVPKTVMTAIDTALIDNANIAGFMFRVDHIDEDTGYPIGVIQSQNEKLKLDATNGKLSCVDADIDGDITVGSMAYKVLYAKGGTYDLTGYGMAIGYGTFELPSVESLYSTEIKMFFVNWSRTTRRCTLNSVDGTPIRIMASTGYGDDVEVYDLPDDNTLYSVILVYDSQDASPYWVVTSNLGGSEGGGISLLVDSEMDEDSEYPVQNKVIVNELKKYATLAGDNDFTGDNAFSGDNDFTGTLSVNGAPIVYNTRYGYWKLDGDLLVTGGVTMYGSDSSFSPSTIMDAIKVDGTTIIVNSSNELEVVGGTGGGAESFWDLTDTPTTLFGYGITDAKISGGTITLGSNTITPLTQALGDDRYLKLAGGTMTGSITLSDNTYIFDDNGWGIVSVYPKEATGIPSSAIGFGHTAAVTYIRSKSAVIVYRSENEYAVLDAGNYSSYLPLLNSGSSHATSSSVIYAPTSAGSSGQVLKSNGSGAPSWVNQSSLSVGTATNLESAPSLASSGTKQITVTAGGKTSSAFTVPYATSANSATLAGSVYVNTSSNSSVFPVVFVSNVGVDYKTLFTDNVSGAGYNPSVNQFIARGFSAAAGTGSSYGFSFDSGNYGVFADNDTLILKTYSLFGISQGSTVRMHMDANGNFGIRTSSPKSALHVAGTIQANTTFNLTEEDAGNATLGYAQGGTMILRHNTSGQTILSGGGGTLYFRPNGTSSDSGQCTISTGGNLLVAGGVTMYSDIRKKTKLEDVELSLDQVADAPLIKHYYNADEKKTIHVGSIAQYWAEMNDWFCKEDEEGFYTMEIQNAALASSISVARDLLRYKSATDKEIRELKERLVVLENEIKTLKGE